MVSRRLGWRSRGHPLGLGHLGDLDADRGYGSGCARQLQAAAGSIDGLQAFVDVAEAYPLAKRLLEAFRRHAQTVVLHFDDGAAVALRGADRDPAAADFARQPMLDRVLDERL